MNWITNYVRPRINSIFSRREIPENLWVKCDDCGTMLFHREMSDNLNVCTNCGHHMNITPRDRFTGFFDGGVFTEVAVPEPVADPLQFRDQKKYPDRMRAAQKMTGEKEAMLVATGEIGRTPVVAAAQDFSFMAGSMGMYVGNAIIAAAEKAVELLGDIQIAEPGALICFAGPRVIEQTIREKLPEGFQRAEYLLDHGMLDRVADRRKLREELVQILRMLMHMPPPVAGDLPPPGPVDTSTITPAEGDKTE
jgi:acetyl-CoA carboxylase beta subunit